MKQRTIIQYRCTRIKLIECIYLQNGATDCTVDLVLYTREQEEFSVDVTEKDVSDKLKGENRDTCKVLEWFLTRSGRQDDIVLWGWEAQRMNNCMTHIMSEKD